MFYQNQSLENKANYEDYLKTVGSLSNLFSESNVPYLYYRLAEKVFCKAFMQTICLEVMWLLMPRKGI